MLSTVQHPPLAASDPVLDVPLDWPGLWSQMLRARDGVSSAQLGHSTDRGWKVDGSLGVRASALFDVYKPLLDW